jgi:hypothetical protein
MVCGDSLDAMSGQLGTASKITATDHDDDLRAAVHYFFDLLRQPSAELGVNTTFEFASQLFT